MRYSSLLLILLTEGASTQARKDVKVLFEGLSEAERNNIIGIKPTAKGPSKASIPVVSEIVEIIVEPKTPSGRAEKKQAKTPQDTPSHDV